MLRRTFRTATDFRAAIFLLFLPIVGCADINPSYNPIEWGRSVGRIFDSNETSTQRVDPPPAEGRPYPNLATVPRRPVDPPGAVEERQRALAELSREREQALQNDRVLREEGRAPPPAAAPPPTPTLTTPMTAASPAAPPMTSGASPPIAEAPRLAAPQPAMQPTPATGLAAVVVTQRVGAVSFQRNGAMLAGASQRALEQAAAAARTSGRIRLMPVQLGQELASPALLRSRIEAMMQVLTHGGVTASRIAVGDDLGRRVDLYDVLVEN